MDSSISELSGEGQDEFQEDAARVIEGYDRLDSSELELEMSEGGLQITTESDSIPELASTESSSSILEYVSDSGVSDRQVGNVTNLWRQRRFNTTKLQLLDSLLQEIFVCYSLIRHNKAKDLGMVALLIARESIM